MLEEVTDKTGDGGGRVRKTGLGLGVGDRDCGGDANLRVAKHEGVD